jgi:hypothetical protein
MYVYIGSLVGDVATLAMPQNDNPQTQIAQWLIKLIGFFATLAVTVYIAHIAKQALNQRIAS